MIVKNFDMGVIQGHGLIYEGTTYFGFFSKEALANQLGVRDAKRYQPSADELSRARKLPRMHPLTPEHKAYDQAASACMPGGAMQMHDEIDVYVRDGGPHGLGYLHGIKQVNPDEWFLQAHFYQDPVWRGSLGLRPRGPICLFFSLASGLFVSAAFLQLLKAALLDHFPELADSR